VCRRYLIVDLSTLFEETLILIADERCHFAIVMIAVKGHSGSIKGKLARSQDSYHMNLT
jgi:hypothetical protein